MILRHTLVSVVSGSVGCHTLVSVVSGSVRCHTPVSVVSGSVGCCRQSLERGPARTASSSLALWENSYNLVNACLQLLHDVAPYTRQCSVGICGVCCRQSLERGPARTAVRLFGKQTVSELRDMVSPACSA